MYVCYEEAQVEEMEVWWLEGGWLTAGRKWFVCYRRGDGGESEGRTKSTVSGRKGRHHKSEWTRFYLGLPRLRTQNEEEISLVIRGEGIYVSAVNDVDLVLIKIAAAFTAKMQQHPRPSVAWSVFSRSMLQKNAALQKVAHEASAFFPRLFVSFTSDLHVLGLDVMVRCRLYEQSIQKKTPCIQRYMSRR